MKASPDVNESEHQPTNVYHDIGVTRNKIVTAQFECYQKIMKENPQSRQGSACGFFLCVCFWILKVSCISGGESMNFQISHSKKPISF